jgi:hypothetical protein
MYQTTDLCLYSTLFIPGRFWFFLHKQGYDSVNWDAFIQFALVRLSILLLFRHKTLFLFFYRIRERGPCFKALSQNCEETVFLSVYSSVRMEQLGSYLTDFHEI